MSDDTLRHMLHGLKQLAEDRHHALAIANSASMFLIQRCEMIEVNPLLGFIFLKHLCERNIDNSLEQSMVAACKHAGVELTEERRAEMDGIVEAMTEAIMHGLTEKEISVEDIG